MVGIGVSSDSASDTLVNVWAPVFEPRAFADVNLEMEEMTLLTAEELAAEMKLKGVLCTPLDEAAMTDETKADDGGFRRFERWCFRYSGQCLGPCV